MVFFLSEIVTYNHDKVFVFDYLFLNLVLRLNWSSTYVQIIAYDILPGVLIEAVVWSVDPYMRVVMTDQNAGDVPVGGQVAKWETNLVSVLC